MGNAARLDAGRILTFLDSIATVQDYHDVVDVVLPELGRLIGAHLVNLSHIDLEAQDERLRSYPEVRPIGDKSTHSKLLSQHPLIRYFLNNPNHEPVMTSDLISRPAYHRLDFYNIFLKHYGVEYQISFPVRCWGPRLGVGFVLCRDSRDFSEDDRTVLTLVRPHLVAAWNRVEARRQLRATLAALEATTDVTVVSIDPQWNVTAASGSLLQALENRIGPVQVGRQLPQMLQSSVQRIGPVTLRRETENPISLGVHGQGLRISLLSGGDAAHGERVLIVKRAPSDEPLKSFGLSAREREVLDQVALGLSNAHIANRLKISPRTVQKHLERIFKKLDVQSRTAAARVYSGETV